MLKIAICDDEKPFLKIIADSLEQYFTKKDIKYNIDIYSSANDIINLGADVVKYTIIFLDINMNEINGIETATAIRKQSEDIFIVFVTAFIDYSLEGYKVGAFRYLLKNYRNFNATITECMDAIMKKRKYEAPRKVFNFRECSKKILIDRIIYIESKLHRLEFHVMEDTVNIYTMYDTLNNIEHVLNSSDFLRIHQSFLINMKHIKCIRNKTAILNNGQEFIIPRARYKDVKNSFTSYKGEL